MTPGLTLALGASVPWVVAPIVATMRASRSTSLEDVPATPSASPALVSVIIPARNERRNIERCVRSVLATTYPAAEVVVVDDHSDDGTGDIARAIARSDVRLRVIDSPPLPDGWFGKQWACATGAQAAHGRLLCFTDADTTHAPDLLVRAVNALVEPPICSPSRAGRRCTVSGSASCNRLCSACC